MDFSYYIKKSGSSARSKNGLKDRNCLYCGKLLENDGSYLFYQSFCSDKCKKEYVEEGSRF